MAKDCIEILKDPEIQKKLFGDQKVSDELIKRMAQDVEWIRENAAKDPSLGNYQSRVNKYIKDQKTNSDATKAVIVNDRRIMRGLKQHILQEAFYENPSEGIIGKISGSTTLGIGARDSAFGRITAIHNEHMNALSFGLEEAGVLEYVKSGQMDHPIREAWQALNRGEGMPDVSPEAKKAATVLHKVYRSLFITTREAGVPVRDLPGYAGPVLDDIKKLRDTPFETWSAAVRSFGIDREKTFGVNAGDATKENQILKAIFDGKRWGGLSSEAPMPTLDEVKEGASYSRKLSATRQLRFMNADGESKYMDSFGRGNLLETVSFDIQRKSRMIGATQVFGSNPEKMINELMTQMQSKYAADGRGDLVQKLANKKSAIENVVKEMTNRGQIPGLSTMENITSGLKTAHSLSKLGWAGFNSLPNLAVTAMQLRSMTGDSFFGSMANIAFDWLKQLPMENRKEAARMAGYMLEDFNIGMFGEPDMWNQPGRGSRMMQMMFKMNGMNAVNSMQNSFSNLFQMAVGEHANKYWADVPTQFKAGLMNVGIVEKDFPFLQKAVQEMPDGRQMVTVEGIRGIDPALVADRAKEVGLSPSRYISDLSYKYYSAIIHGGTDSTTSSTFRERSATAFGQNKGTWQRGVLDLVMQFKQFYFQSANIALKTLNMAPDEAKLSRGILVSKDKQYGEFAKLLVGTTAMGYASMMLKEGITTLSDKAWKSATGTEALSHHKSVDPTQVSTWLDAMNRGGAAGLYMDFLFGDNDQFKPSQALAGPTFGQLYDLSADAVARLRKESVKSAQGYIDTGKFQTPGYGPAGMDGAGKQFVRDMGMMAKQLIPFGQFPIIQQAVNYGFYNKLQESLSPGYIERRKLRSAKERAQGL